MSSKIFKKPGLFLFILFAVGIPLIPSTVHASTLPGSFSAGLGGGFGDEKMGPFVVSGKYWSRSWEAGAEIFYDGDKDNDIDQIGLIWAMYRQDLHPEERNWLYAGLGAGFTLEENLLKSSTGIVGAIGWDGKDYGLELKYGYFKPSIFSFVAYWHF
ncbi:MAG TPA: hypothetical protein ENN67_07130 [Firmicutes bacterium]|nr:hypothetical protein [Bacillota bacterium]